MPRKAAGLTAQKVVKAGPGRYGDGNGLYLLVRPARALGMPDGRFWVFRYVMGGKMREMGLGRAPGTTADKGVATLGEVRSRAGDLFRKVQQGIDPLAERDAETARCKAEAQHEAALAKSFREVAELYINGHETAWRNAKHRQQWTNTLEAYAYPYMGDLPCGQVSTAEVMAALEPIWAVKPETASRVRGRIESVLDYATARGWRSGENPARWRGHLADLLPARRAVAVVEHHPALPYQEIGAFMETLHEQAGLSAQALEFTILTAARTGEVLGARWEEIDQEGEVWTIPGERMKAGREHRVPLSAPAKAVLAKVPRDGGPFVFPGGRAGRPLSTMALLMTLRRMGRGDLTVHGFRSTFRDWVAECTGYPGEVAEAALAHTIGDKVEAAYRRGDLFDKRSRLMEDWAKFCANPAAGGGDILPIRRTKAEALA